MWKITEFLLFIYVVRTSQHSAIDDVFRLLEKANEMRRIEEQSDIAGEMARRIDEYGPTSLGESRHSESWCNYNVRGSSKTFVKIQYDMILERDTYDQIFSKDYVSEQEFRSCFAQSGYEDYEDYDYRGKRNAVMENKRWSRQIPYVIDGAFNNSDQMLIQTAMQMWSNNTCLSFVQRGLEDDYIYFNSSDECSSYVGRQKGRQFVNLNRPGCMAIPIILHELGHVIGLFHEQSRADRDDYVIVHQDKVQNTKWHNFKKKLPGTYLHYNKPYDFYSIMHYGKSSFAKTTSDITIQPKGQEYIDVIGKAQVLSFYDVQIVNAMYRCAEFHECPSIPHATIQGTGTRHFYKIECLVGYTMTLISIGSFICNGDGVWKPFKPDCIPVTCSQPDLPKTRFSPHKYRYVYKETIEMLGCRFNLQYRGNRTLVCNAYGSWDGTATCTYRECQVDYDSAKAGVTTESGHELRPNSNVSSGLTIIMTCIEKGHVPEKITLTCRNGKYVQTGDTQVPVCKQVLCNPPELPGMTYIPEKSTYLFGESVRVACNSYQNRFEGDIYYECNAQGIWIGNGRCLPVCERGLGYFKRLQDLEFMPDIYRKFEFEETRCKQMCAVIGRNKCQAYDFGYENGKPQCRVTNADPFKSSINMYRVRQNWTLGIYKCHHKDLLGYFGGSFNKDLPGYFGESFNGFGLSEALMFPKDSKAFDMNLIFM